MPSKRPHTKTRLGCFTCKQRRVRCDLARPTCANCVRLERQCTWPESLFIEPHPAGGAQLENSSSQVTSGDGRGSLQSFIPNDTIEHMLLLHHFTTRTSLTLSEERDKQTLWQAQVPKHALKARFLLHGVLCVAALHYGGEQSQLEKSHWIDLARRHYVQALDHYLDLLQRISQENCHSLYAFSCLSGVASYGFLRLLEPRSQPDEFIDKTIETLELLGGSAIITNQAHKWLENGDLAVLAKPPRTASQHIAPSPQLRLPSDALTSLLAYVQTVALAADAEDGPSQTPKISDSKQVYISSIESLFPILPKSDTSPPSLDTVTRWPTTVDPAFFELLKKRDSTAMIILSHYGTILHCLTDVWWLQGVGSKMHAAVNASIDKEWRPYLNMSSWQVAKTSFFSRRPGLRGPLATAWAGIDHD